MAIAKKEPEKVTEIKTAKVETPKPEAKKAEPEKNAEPTKKAQPEKKSEPAKAPATETAASKTAAEKKTTAAKRGPAAKKTEPKTSLVLEFEGKQINSKDVIAAAKKAFTKANKGVVIKTLDVYVKPEEHVAYYVVNGQGSDDYKVSL